MYCAYWILTNLGLPPLEAGVSQIYKSIVPYRASSILALQVYINYPVLAIVFIMLVIVTAFITMIVTYYQLAKEDYRWWWRSFLCGGSTSKL